MAYKPIIFERNKDGNQYAIINDDGPSFKTNLNDNEILIKELSHSSCPLKRNCIDYAIVDIYGKISILCENFKEIFRSEFSIFCSKSDKYIDVSTLKPFCCPNSRENCMGCNNLINIVAKPYPEKSNCHVVCTPLEAFGHIIP